MGQSDDHRTSYVVAEGRYRVDAALANGFEEEWEELDRRFEIVDGYLICTRLEDSDVGPAGTIALMPPGTKLVLWPAEPTS